MKQKTFSTLPNKEQALLIGFLTPENMIGERNVSFEELAALAGIPYYATFTSLLPELHRIGR